MGGYDMTVDELSEGLKNGPYDTRVWCAMRLGLCDAAAANTVPALIEALENDPVVAVRLACAWALGQIRPASVAAVPALRSVATKDSSWNVRVMSTRALGFIISSVAEPLKD